MTQQCSLESIFLALSISAFRIEPLVHRRVAGVTGEKNGGLALGVHIGIVGRLGAGTAPRCPRSAKSELPFPPIFFWGRWP